MEIVQREPYEFRYPHPPHTKPYEFLGPWSWIFEEPLLVTVCRDGYL